MSEPGLTVVYLEASDSGSGVKSIQYSLDGGAVVEYSAPIVLTVVGVHQVSYRAGDAAGQYSLWQSEGADVVPYTPGRLVKDLVFAYWRPGREVVESVQVGQTLYAPSDGDPEDVIKALPEYLVGANYIRLHRNDKSYAGEEFASFTASEDLTVYLMKHKKSAAVLSGWALVAKDFPVEPLKYFKGGADIYQRSYRAGDRVRVPGTRGGGESWPNLIFVQRSVSQEVRILSPEPGVELVTLSTVSLYGTNLAQTVGATRSWAKRIGEGPWEEVVEGSVNLPYTREGTTLSLKLVMSDANCRCPRSGYGNRWKMPN